MAYSLILTLALLDTRADLADRWFTRGMIYGLQDRHSDALRAYGYSCAIDQHPEGCRRFVDGVMTAWARVGWRIR